MPARRWLLALSLASLVALPACSGGGAERSCGVIEQLFEPAPYHVFLGAEVNYRHHPPTSGPHVATVLKPGTRRESLPEPEQVMALEVGMVILHYSKAVAPEDVKELEALAAGRDDVIVTPAATPIDGGQAVAFTAWGHRQRCGGVALNAAREFIDRFVGRG